MQLALVALAAFVLLGGKSSSARPAPPPQQTPPANDRGQSTGQVVADVVVSVVDAFRKYLEGK
jgi:hypothetical protein